MFQNLFNFVTYPMELGLVWLTIAVGSAGIGIILFTIFVRAVLSPLQITQLRNAKAMQRLQPHMLELKKKHGSDRQKLQQETMALYKEHGANPAMGCLPMLVQLPILFGLFYALMHLGTAPSGWPDAIKWVDSTCDGHHVSGFTAWFSQCYGFKNMSGTPAKVFELFHANFLWLNHGLGKPDPLYILPVLAGATQWVQSRMMLTRSTDPQQQMMNTLMNFMPLMIVVFATRYPSGLSLYWVTSTVIGIVIQYRITGWGLVPIPWGGGNTIARKKGTGNSLGKSGVSQSPKLALVPADTRPNGTSGESTNGADGDRTNGASGGSVQISPAPRPRKKANRARGGKGGRRG